MKPSKLLTKAAKLISEPGSWVKHAYANPTGDAFCMLGAIHKANGSLVNDFPEGTTAIEMLDWSSYPFIESEIADFNDADDTTNDDAVLALLFLAQLKPEEKW